MKYHRVTLAFVALTALSAPARAQGQALAEPRLLAKLRQPATLTWSGQTISAALQRVGETRDLACWLDRRVDPGAEVELSVRDTPWLEALAQLADSQGLGCTPFQSLVYIGPPSTADELATLAARARDALARADPATRARWLRPAPWSFPRLSEPQQLLEETLQSVGAELVGQRRLPHDLWPARTLPALAPVDRVVLILAGFDVAGEISPTGQELRLVPIERPVTITRRYPSRHRRLAAFEQALAALPPENVRERGGQMEISARWEQHEQLRAAVRPPTAQRDPKPAPAGLEAQRFTLKIENQPVDRVVEQLARQLDLAVIWSNDPPADKLVSCDVSQADLDGLLEAILSPVGLASSREGRTVTIRAAR